jgi:chromosome segregation ATPase
MTDDRIVQRLEEQLVQVHSTNADLRGCLASFEKREQEVNRIKVEGRDALAQLEKASAKQKQAEDNAAAAQRKCDDAEREALRANGELEELRNRCEIVKAEADKHRALIASSQRSTQAISSGRDYPSGKIAGCPC